MEYYIVVVYPESANHRNSTVDIYIGVLFNIWNIFVFVRLAAVKLPQIILRHIGV